MATISLASFLVFGRAEVVAADAESGDLHAGFAEGSVGNLAFGRFGLCVRCAGCGSGGEFGIGEHGGGECGRSFYEGAAGEVVVDSH